MATSEMPLIGMIVPPAAGAVPPEAPALYPQGARFIAEGLGLERLTPDGYDAVIDDVVGAAERLAERGADVVVLMGTSLSFYRGASFNRSLIAAMKEATGLPATTMSAAIVEALKAVGGRRIALATAYVDDVNRRLADFLRDEGFEIAGLAALEIADVNQILAVSEDTLADLGNRGAAAAPDADTLFISCGGLRTLGVTATLEATTGLPVVSSAVAGAWSAMRLAGLPTQVDGRGRLLAA